MSRDNRPIVQSKMKEEMRQMYEHRIALYQKYAAYTIQNHGTVEEAVEQIVGIVKEEKNF